MANFNYAARGTALTILTTQIESLANGSLSSYGVEVDYSLAGSPKFCDVLFVINPCSLTFTASSIVIVHFVPAMDGTNYPLLTAGASYKFSEGNYPQAEIRMHPAAMTSANMHVGTTRVPVPNAKWKPVLLNKTGLQLPLSGVSVQIYPTFDAY